MISYKFLSIFLRFSIFQAKNVNHTRETLSYRFLW